jgi:hypothetical protein
MGMSDQSASISGKMTFSLLLLESIRRGFTSIQYWNIPAQTPPSARSNPLRTFFNERKTGHGIWKWDHYFDIYDRHFSRFRGGKVHVLEIGVYSGGSLDMWKHYFGPQASIYGADIEPACKSYESESIKIFVGDQADRKFWSQVRQQVPRLDIVIDDGGHHPEQQIVTIEELLPHMQPGGIYLCEDVHEIFNPFASYVHGMAHRLNDFGQAVHSPDNNERRIVCRTTQFQSAVGSVHLYPYVTIVERNTSPVAELVAPKHGTTWQPYLK